MVIKTVCHFVDYYVGVEISSKERGEQKKKGRVLEGFWKKFCSSWEGANVLPWGRKDLSGGLGVGENYTN